MNRRYYIALSLLALLATATAARAQQKGCPPGTVQVGETHATKPDGTPIINILCQQQDEPDPKPAPPASDTGAQRQAICGDGGCADARDAVADNGGGHPRNGKAMQDLLDADVSGENYGCLADGGANCVHSTKMITIEKGQPPLPEDVVKFEAKIPPEDKKKLASSIKLYEQKALDRAAAKDMVVADNAALADLKKKGNADPQAVADLTKKRTGDVGVLNAANQTVEAVQKGMVDFEMGGISLNHLKEPPSPHSTTKDSGSSKP